jgi:hypothetical protein
MGSLMPGRFSARDLEALWRSLTKGAESLSFERFRGTFGQRLFRESQQANLAST